MKRVYADLHLCLNLRDFEQVSRMISKASALGYGMVGVVFPSHSSEVEVERLRKICREANVDLASRIDLRPRSAGELLHGLRRLRRRFEVVAVVCEVKSVARQAAKDRRVDLLNFPYPDFRGAFFDWAEAELACKALASLEVDVKPLLTLEGSSRVRLLASLRREVAIARKFRVPIVVSSGVSDELLMRKPMENAALAALFDLDEASALKAVSVEPLAIVKRNREKLSPRFVAPGIRVVRRGRDCREE